MSNLTDHIEFWDCDKDAEHLSHTSSDEALEYYLDDLPTDEWSEYTVVHGYVRAAVDPTRLEDAIIRWILEDLDEEYCGRDSDPTEANEAMKTAEAVFIGVILAEYDVRVCRPAIEEKVHTMTWARANVPEWLEDE